MYLFLNADLDPSILNVACRRFGGLVAVGQLPYLQEEGPAVSYDKSCKCKTIER